MFNSCLPSSHGEVRDGVVVGLEDLGIVENFVSERVEPVQGHSDVCGRHPVLNGDDTDDYSKHAGCSFDSQRFSGNEQTLSKRQKCELQPPEQSPKPLSCSSMQENATCSVWRRRVTDAKSDKRLRLENEMKGVFIRNHRFWTLEGNGFGLRSSY